MSDLTVAIANAVHLVATDGEHGNAYEPGDPCQHCIAYAASIERPVAEFVRQWLIGEAAIIPDYAPEDLAVIERVIDHWERASRPDERTVELVGFGALPDTLEVGSIQSYLDAQPKGPTVSCANCRYWNRGDEHSGENVPEGWHICNAVVYTGDGVTAFVSARGFHESGYLFTSPEHCCSMWE